MKLSSMKAAAQIECPGPATWAWVLAIPLCWFSNEPIWWPYWLMHLLALYVTARWALDWLKEKALARSAASKTSIPQR